MEMKRTFKYLLIFLVAGTFLFFGSYTCWNLASPQKTCMSCHEIRSSVAVWESSAHRSIACKECHGTALSNGFHSLKEKTKMITSHLRRTEYETDVKMNEEQVLETMGRCVKCHQMEYANWRMSGHSAKYSDIFLNEKHNKTERLNFDCLRCHGMFYKGTIGDLVDPVSQDGPWKLKDPSMSEKPTIPCLACHQVHIEGKPAAAPDYSNPARIFENQPTKIFAVGFFNRPDHDFFQSEFLPKGKILDGEREIKISDDPRQRVCIQCHAPNAWHQTLTSDDRTTTGVHEGLSCLACHSNHSNKADASCKNCHPAISNCGIPVDSMNTTFKDRNSPNNIHFVKCSDCHKKEMKHILKIINK
jgi:hypothetical protein